MLISALPENFSLVSVVADNTETYFIPNDKNVHRIFRRTAIGLLRQNKSGYDNYLYPIYMTESGDFLINFKNNILMNSPCDCFTVGVPKILGEVWRITESNTPEEVLPLIRELKTEHRITFRKPSCNIITINIFAGEKTFYLENEEEENIDNLPFGHDYGIWEKSFPLNNPEESLAAIGKWLGFFRYVLDVPELRYNLRFDRTKDWTPEQWEKEMVIEGNPPYEEQRRIDAEWESTYKKPWEQTIHAEADRYYSFIVGDK